MQHVDGLVIKHRSDCELYCTSYPRIWNVLQSRKPSGKGKPLWYGGKWLKYKYGEASHIDYITLSQIHTGKYHVLTDGWKHILCRMSQSKTLSAVLKSKSYGDIARQKELSHIMGLSSETPSQTSGPKNMTLSGYITSCIMHQPLGKANNTMDW